MNIWIVGFGMAAILFGGAFWRSGKSIPLPPPIPGPVPGPTKNSVVIARNLRVGLLLRYADAKGVVTERQVIANQLIGRTARDGTTIPHSVRAYCLARKGIRAFRLDRVQEAIDAETGEIIQDLCRYLLERTQERGHD